MTEPNEDQESEPPKRIKTREAEVALEAIGNLLYLIEIDHKDEERLEAYLLMTRSNMETLSSWFYGDPCRAQEKKG